MRTAWVPKSRTKDDDEDEDDFRQGAKQILGLIQGIVWQRSYGPNPKEETSLSPDVQFEQPIRRDALLSAPPPQIVLRRRAQWVVVGVNCRIEER